MTSKINKLRAALAIALIAAAGPVAALGLGQIQVKSRLDQPLLAEIPIISSDPAELEQLQARLASPDTFRRIGLEPPTGVTADLQFSVALDATGNPVIRVTSSAPVNQPLVSFLVEVDWGQGRLVREYSALLDTPRTVSAPAQPPIEAPVLAPSNTIAAPVVAPPEAETPEPLPGEVAAVPDAEAEAPAEPEAIAVAPEPEPPPPAPVAAITPAPSVADRSLASPSQLNVQRGDTLSELAGSLDAGRDYTLDQTMLALLRANPEAFINDNINLLKQGAVLRVPTAGEVAQYSQAEAAAVVRDHIDQWRGMRQPAPQPAAVASSGADSATSDAASSDARVAGARLAIMPPSNGGDRPGTRSGTSAGGEGEMLRQELQQSKEDLAARAAEVNELKARVAELEQLQQQQQQLISMKDSELAAAQQRLADARKAAPATVATPAEQAAEKNESAGATPWIFGGVGLIALGLLAWLFTRRRGDKPGSPRRTYDTAALAAGIPTAAAGPGREDLFADDSELADEPPAMAPPPPQWTGTPAAVAVPTWHGGAPVADPVVAERAAADIGNASQQLELARAYLDLGDDDAARALLREVLDSRDPAARDTAAKMLRDL